MSKSHHLLIAPIYRYPFMLWVWTAHQSPITFRVWITLWSPFTLQVWIAHQSPFTLWVWIVLRSPFTLQVDYDATSAMFSTHIHRWVGKYLSGYRILTMDYTQSRTICVFSTHAFLYGKNLHATSKDPSKYLYPHSMGSKALRTWNINSISSLQGNILNIYILTVSPVPF